MANAKSNGLQLIALKSLAQAPSRNGDHRKAMRDVYDCSPTPRILTGIVSNSKFRRPMHMSGRAMDAMTSNPPSERKIRIRVFSESDQIKIIISDSGHGLSTDIRKTLFQPFVTTKERGLGLGLSICASILKAYSGKITIENSVDRGAPAILTLPVLEALVPAQ